MNKITFRFQYIYLFFPLFIYISVSQTDQKSVINCLLEVARIGYKFGLEPPSIIKMETEIEEEEEIPVSKPVEIVRPLSNKVPNLDAEVLLFNKER